MYGVGRLQKCQADIISTRMIGRKQYNLHFDALLLLYVYTLLRQKMPSELCDHMIITHFYFFSSSSRIGIM